MAKTKKTVTDTAEEASSPSPGPVGHPLPQGERDAGPETMAAGDDTPLSGDPLLAGVGGGADAMFGVYRLARAVAEGGRVDRKQVDAALEAAGWLPQEWEHELARQRAMASARAAMRDGPAAVEAVEKAERAVEDLRLERDRVVAEADAKIAGAVRQAAEARNRLAAAGEARARLISMAPAPMKERRKKLMLMRPRLSSAVTDAARLVERMHELVATRRAEVARISQKARPDEHAAATQRVTEAEGRHADASAALETARAAVGENERMISAVEREMQE